MHRTSQISLGENKGTPRVYLQGRWLLTAGFEPGDQYEIDFGNSEVKIIRSPSGRRKVSGKAKNTIPVIDIQSTELGAALRNANKLVVAAANDSITITPAYSLLLSRSRLLAPTEASFFSGGGFLSLAAKLAGFDPKLGVEIEPAYADIYQANHPMAEMFNMSVHEVPWEKLKTFRPIGLFTAGIPCQPFSSIRTVSAAGKRDKSLPPEAHELGDLTFFTCRGIEALNPHTVVIEEVPRFLESASGIVLLAFLRKLYPYVDAKILNPHDYGCLTGRNRAVVIASERKITWPEQTSTTQRLGEIFDPAPHEWFDRSSKGWLFDHWDKQTARGNGFASQVYDENSPYIGTIKSRYFAQQGDNPVIRHPTKPDTYRWLTLPEVRRLHGIPDDYDIGSAKTTAGEVIGQGVVVDLFRRVIESVTKQAPASTAA